MLIKFNWNWIAEWYCFWGIECCVDYKMQRYWRQINNNNKDEDGEKKKKKKEKKVSIQLRNKIKKKRWNEIAININVTLSLSIKCQLIFLSFIFFFCVLVEISLLIDWFKDFHQKRKKKTHSLSLNNALHDNKEKFQLCFFVISSWYIKSLTTWWSLHENSIYKRRLKVPRI